MKAKYLKCLSRDYTTLNKEATEKIQSNPVQLSYVRWLEENGFTCKSLKFPAAFGQNGLPGILATEDIPPFTEICSLPSKLMLSLDTIRASELKPIFEKHNFLFFYDREADSICFTVYLLRQLVKGDSFWRPYINRALAQDTELAYQWSDDLLKELQDCTLSNDVKGYGKEVDKQWKNVSEILSKYPDLFPKGKWDRITYMKLYKYIVTHTFGGTMPCTMILPFSECFNHENKCPIILDICFKGKEPPVEDQIKYDPNVNPNELLKTKQIWAIPKDPDSDYEDKESDKEDSDEGENEASKSLFTTKIHPRYKWWNPKSPEIHCFMRTGAKAIPKNSHVFYAYGIRSNADLLSTFGFVLVPNKRDILKITLWNNLNPWHNLKDCLNSLLVPEETAGKVETAYKETLFDTEDPIFKEAELTTKTAKLGWTHLPSKSLMAYIRKQQMTHFKGKDADKLMMSRQIVARFEIECLEIAIEILLRKKKTWKTTLDEDIKLIEEAKTSKAKWRWVECLYYRIGQKKLLDLHIEGYGLLIEILKNINESGLPYKEAYMKVVPKYEREEEKEIIENRMMFRGYLQKLAQARKHLLGLPYE